MEGYNHNKYQSKRRKQIVEDPAVEKGSDATRFKRVTREELEHMASLIFFTVTIPNNVDPDLDSSFLCWEAQETYHGRSALRHVKIGSRNLRSKPHITEFTKFRIGGVMMALEGRFATAKNDDVSHLCGNWKCCRASHLVWESRKKNLQRNNCPGQVICAHGCWCNACVHEPKCVKKTKIE